MQKKKKKKTAFLGKNNYIQGWGQEKNEMSLSLEYLTVQLSKEEIKEYKKHKQRNRNHLEGTSLATSGGNLRKKVTH